MSWDGKERRKAPRAVIPCKIIVLSPDHQLVSHTENISSYGIRVILEEELVVFDLVGLELFLKKETPIRCEGRVRWVIKKINPLEGQPTMFDTGIAFEFISDDDRKYIGEVVNTILCSGENQE